MTGGSLLDSALGGWNILASILVSLVVLGAIWRLHWIVDRLTNASEETRENIRAFRDVAMATVVLLTIVWIGGQPQPSWLVEGIQALRGPQAVTALRNFLPDFVLANFRSLLITIMGLWWAWELRAQGDEVIERLVEKRYDEQLAPIVENVWDVTVAVGYIILLLTQWGIRVAALLAPAGILGLIISFAARKSVANFFGSLSLYADETYSRGDYIELESGISGTVRDISVRSTVLQTLDGDLVTIPNSTLNEGKIINRSDPTTHRRISSEVGVTYSADPDRVKKILSAVAEPLSKRHEPMVHLRSFDDSSLTFEVFIWIESESNRRVAEDELNTAIYHALEEANIEIPFPQQEVTVEREEQDSEH